MNAFTDRMERIRRKIIEYLDTCLAELWMKKAKKLEKPPLRAKYDAVMRHVDTLCFGLEKGIHRRFDLFSCAEKA